MVVVDSWLLEDRLARGLDAIHVGGVEPAAEADFEQGPVRGGSREGEEGRRRG